MMRTKKMMENYVCPICFNQLDKCICKSYPPWSLIMVDKGIQEVVRILNNKGYITKASCESHYDGNHILYVSFLMDFPFSIPVPDGLKYNKIHKIIEYRFKKKDLESKEKFDAIKAQKIELLTEWVKQLPPLKF